MSCCVDIPNAPHAITVRYKSSTVIHLDVEPPDDDGGDRVTGYQVEYFQSRVLRYDIGMFMKAVCLRNTLTFMC